MRKPTRSVPSIMALLGVPLLGCWLLVWMWFSWGALRDDALIHLRYADFLYRVHFISFDGVHHTYGTSSVFYVVLLAGLRAFIASPLLPGGVSTFFHLLLFITLAVYFYRHLREASFYLQAMALVLILILCAPSAVRWLDDGMETGLVLLAVGLTAWFTHRLSREIERRPLHRGLLLLLGMFLVLLRTELLVLCALVFAILCLAEIRPASGQQVFSRWVTRCAPVLVGASLAVGSIFLIFHSFLPDTAIAKSHGPALVPVIRSTATVLAGGMLFGFGLMVLWLLSAFTVLRMQYSELANRLPTLAANALFPLVLLSSVMRGQEIQGARYLAWTFFFSICWNLLELKSLDQKNGHLHNVPDGMLDKRSAMPAHALLLACLLIVPLECRPILRSLDTQKHTVETFREENLASVLHGRLGVAGDVGAIGYFTQADICDLAGLVNGRAAAARSVEERAQACSSAHPDFAFVNEWQYDVLSQYMDLSHWVACGAPYQSSNLHSADPHALLVKPELASAVCRLTPPATAASTFAFIKHGSAASTN